MTIYTLSESFHRGGTCTLYKTLSEAKRALRIKFKENLNMTGAAEEGENCYCTGVNALISTEHQDDYWYAVIEKHNV